MKTVRGRGRPPLLKTAVDRVLRDAAKAGSPNSDAYWNVRVRGLDEVANALLGERPVEPVTR